MTSASRDKFRWAKRVARRKVRRLYESDAQGGLDTDLLDEVGIRLFRKKHSRAKCLAIAQELGIQGRSSMPEDELVSEIRRLDPARFSDIG